MKNKVDYKKLGIIIGIYVVLFLGFYFSKNLKDRPSIREKDQLITGDREEDIDIEHPQGKIFVDISGEVHYPGLLELDSGARLYEAVEMAGGLTTEADSQSINLSQVLDDQDKIHIPGKSEADQSSTSSGKININTGTKEELMTLPGIGEKTAESIISYREDYRFDSIEDIMNVPGIGEAKFSQIEKFITK